MNKKFILIQSSRRKSDCSRVYEITRLEGCENLKLVFPCYSSARNFASASLPHHSARVILAKDYRRNMSRTELLEAEVKAISQAV